MNILLELYFTAGENDRGKPRSITRRALHAEKKCSLDPIVEEKA